MIYFASFSVFAAVIITLVLFLLLLEAKVAPKGSARIVIASAQAGLMFY